jgi:putative tricarboxylic transport membrane protein
LLEFFGLASWTTGLGSLLFGSALGFLFGFIPGLGGRIGLILSLPIAVFFPPYEAAIFLFAMHSVVNTSGAIPNIAFGIPSSSADMATIIDGYPLAKMGRAGEALGASLSSSAIGGVLGAVAFLISIPIARPLVTSFGPPEFLMLSIFGVTMVSSLSREGLLPGMIVAALGVLVAMIGIDARSAEARFTFGWVELWDGVGLPAIVCGFFVVPEMLSLTALDRDSHERAISTTIVDVFRGMFVTLNHMRVVLWSTLYGILIGVAPALGSSISVWMSYDYAARTTKSDIPFGQGAIAGVIAPEAANNSKEGGAMIPTLFFGIPGSSSMAIMMGALSAAGVAIGPNLLSADIGLSYALAATVCLANLIVVPLFFLVIPTLVRMSSIRRESIIPFAIAISVTAALIDSPRPLTIVLIIISAIFGIALKAANWPRAPFILGYVIGDMAEKSYFHTVALYGWSALTRPITLGLIIFLLVWLFHVARTRPILHIPGPRMPTLSVSAGLMLFFAATIVTAFATINSDGRLPPVFVSLAAAGLCAFMFVVAWRTTDAPPPEPIRHAGALALFFLTTPVVGVIVSSFGFCAFLLRSIGVAMQKALLLALVFCALQALLLHALFDVAIEKEIIGRIAYWYLGY